MHYVMEACAENNKMLIILDRPNPLGDYVDGPVLNMKCQSFIGMHPIPVIHGLTIGELALMINGEAWLKNNLKCDLHVVKLINYDHSKAWSLPIKPSPNLPNDMAVRLYPSLCFFEATEISIGRGTIFPFQVIGYPNKKFGEFIFIPEDIPGKQMNPIHNIQRAYLPVSSLNHIQHQHEIHHRMGIHWGNTLHNKLSFFVLHCQDFLKYNSTISIHNASGIRIMMKPTTTMTAIIPRPPITTGHTIMASIEQNIIQSILVT